jgi:hypothetical protein
VINKLKINPHEIWAILVTEVGCSGYHFKMGKTTGGRHCNILGPHPDARLNL